MAMAASMAALMLASLSGLPRRASSAAVARSAVGPTLVRPMRAWLTEPALMRSTTAAPAVAQSPVLRLSFS